MEIDSPASPAVDELRRSSEQLHASPDWQRACARWNSVEKSRAERDVVYRLFDHAHRSELAAVVAKFCDAIRCHSGNNFEHLVAAREPPAPREDLVRASFCGVPCGDAADPPAAQFARSLRWVQDTNEGHVHWFYFLFGLCSSREMREEYAEQSANRTGFCTWVVKEVSPRVRDCIAGTGLTARDAGMIAFYQYCRYVNVTRDADCVL